MEILDGGELDKALGFLGGILDEKTWKTIYEVIDEKYFKNLDVKFPKYLLLKFRQEFNVSHFIPIDVKKIQQIGLYHGFFSHIVKIKQKIIGEVDISSNKKRKKSIF